MSGMPGYPFAAAHGTPFDPNWSAYYSSYATNAYFHGSPNTSGSSNESMNGRIDPKKSPKYLEKRQKNNEAARKSRQTRKARENSERETNEKLKQELAEGVKECEKFNIQLHKITMTMESITEENIELKRRLAQLQSSPLNSMDYTEEKVKFKIL